MDTKYIEIALKKYNDARANMRLIACKIDDVWNIAKDYLGNYFGTNFSCENYDSITIMGGLLKCTLLDHDDGFEEPCEFPAFLMRDNCEESEIIEWAKMRCREMQKEAAAEVVKMEAFRKKGELAAARIIEANRRKLYEELREIYEYRPVESK